MTATTERVSKFLHFWEMIVYVHRSAPILSWSRTRELLPSFWRHMPQRNRQNLSMVSWIQQQWVLTDGSCFFPFYLHTPPLLPHCSSYPLLPLTLFCPRFPSWSGTRGHANFQQDQSVTYSTHFKGRCLRFVRSFFIGQIDRVLRFFGQRPSEFLFKRYVSWATEIFLGGLK